MSGVRKSFKEKTIGGMFTKEKCNQSLRLSSLEIEARKPSLWAISSMTDVLNCRLELDYY